MEEFNFGKLAGQTSEAIDNWMDHSSGTYKGFFQCFRKLIKAATSFDLWLSFPWSRQVSVGLCSVVRECLPRRYSFNVLRFYPLCTELCFSAFKGFSHWIPLPPSLLLVKILINSSFFPYKLESCRWLYGQIKCFSCFRGRLNMYQDFLGIWLLKVTCYT